ncbi:porin [Diaphorobacter sp. HDW4A]|uniref:porin n=1 Tax=Diaphorobacter sp. HDW4A TaxID=2714924 RepID=UPI00140946D4|nr:porin [Diaphorobacter sp. HDW4A]QIL79688.1 porin [Diaphorobacter sp. HDW4A]
MKAKQWNGPLALTTATVASALCLTAMPAWAQSSVTITGAMDMGLLNMSNYSRGIGYLPTSAHDTTDTRAKDGGLGSSNIGFKGVEDLGGGMKATFHLHGNINLANGTAGGPNSSATTSFFNQMSTVGLSGSFGEIKLGRQFSPAAWAMMHTDVRGMRYFGSTLTALVSMNAASKSWIGNNSNVAFGTIYDDNTLAYTAPVWNNLKLDFAYTFGEGRGKANSQQSVTALYTNGGLKLSALYYNGFGNNYGTAVALYTAAAGGNAAAGTRAAEAAGFSPTANTNRLYAAGALYSTGAWTIGGQYYAARNPSHAVMPGGSDSLDMLNFGLGWKPMPQLNLLAGYYYVRDNKNDGHKATQFVMGAEYLLSRRTWLYLQGAYVTNKGDNMAMSPMYATPVAADRNVRAYMAGVRHTF